MSAVSDSKRNRKAKKKRSTPQMKENEVRKASVTNLKTGSFVKSALDATVPLSQVVNKSSFTPFLDGERCILCHQERPNVTWKAERSNAGTDMMFGPQQFVDKLPLWVCPECRKRVEDDERKAGLDSALNTVNNEMLFQPSEGVINSFIPEDGLNKDLCSCHSCTGKRLLVPAKTKEVGELQFSWFEVKHFVRCVYRKAGTTLADDDTLSKTSLDVDRMKSHTDKLTSTDAYQLYERLEAQTREYLNEVRVSLIKFFTSSFSNSPQHAKDCVMTLLDEYQSLCVATNILKPFFHKLDANYFNHFEWSWELMNKEIYKEEIFEHPIIRNKLPLLFSCFMRDDVFVPDNCAKSPKTELVKRFEAFTWEITEVDNLWLVAKPLQEKYDKENSHGKGERENWDEPLKITNATGEDIYGCNKYKIANQLATPDDLLFLQRALSSSNSPPTPRAPTQYCSKHAQNGSAEGEDPRSPTQLLPTALFLNRLTNSKCATCIREALHSFCFDEETSVTKCRHSGEHDFPASLPNKLANGDPPDVYRKCDDYGSHDVFWYNHDTPPPETASSVQSLLLNGDTGGKVHCKNRACCTKWGEDNRADEGYRGHDGSHGHEGCRSRWPPLSPSIVIPDNNLDMEAPPSSPSSDRSVGDGSSSDTPTSRSSLSEDGGRPNNGKYCDCCYCEVFGNGNPPVAPTSHNYVEIREKLRSRLKEKERKTLDFSDIHKGLSCITDSRSVDELLTFINGEQERDQNLKSKASSKAAKRQRQKQKKAAEKVTSVPEINEKGSCLLKQVEGHDERPSFCEERSRKNTRHKKSNKAKSQESLTERENATNREKTFANNVKRGIKDSKRAANIPEEKPAITIQESGAGNHIDKRKKSKEKKIGVNKAADNAKERQVVVNGFAEESGTGVELTHGMRIPAEEAPGPEALAESQTKKTKSRKKKKGQCLDDVFLPKENLSNGHSGEVDEAEREIEEFKRFCASTAPVTRKLKLPANVNLKNLNLGLKKC